MVKWIKLEVAVLFVLIESWAMVDANSIQNSLAGISFAFWGRG